MPCRANRCHRAAARLLHSQPAPSPVPSSHIWISDDHLSQAFSRFTLAVSLNSTSKRHGSNVPGPLEARRRSARRRIVGLASHQPPTIPDFGSLFGTGSPSAPVDVGSLWKPPRSEDGASMPLSMFFQQQHQVNPPTLLSEHSLHEQKRPPSTVYTRHSPRHTSNRLSKKTQTTTDYERPLRRCNTLESIVHLHANLWPDGEVPLSFSKAAFQRLLTIATARWHHAGNVQDEHLLHITAFLQHELNHELAGNVKAYYMWFKDKSLSQPALTHFSQILADKISLASIPIEEAQFVIKRLSASVVTRLPRDQHHDLITHVYQSLASAIHGRLSLCTHHSERYHICTALLEGLGNLIPTAEAVRLILTTYSSLPPTSRGQATPLIAQAIAQWLIRLGRHNAFPPEPTEGQPSPLMLLLNGLDPLHAEDIIINTTARFMTDDLVGQARRNTTITYWLYLLRRCTSVQDQQWDSSVWEHIYLILSDHLALDNLDAHFVAMGPLNSTRVILRHWIAPGISNQVELPRVKALNKPSTTSVHANVSYTVAHQTGAYLSDGSSRPRFLGRTPRLAPRTTEVTSLRDNPLADEERRRVFEKIEADFEARVALYPKGSVLVSAPFADLVTVLYQHQQCHDYALDEVMRLLLHYESPTRLYNLAMELCKRSVYIPPSVALPLINCFIDTGNVGFALRIFQACENVWPSLCPKLIFALIEQGPVTTNTLFEILNRPEFSNSLPMPLRSDEPNSLSEQRVELVHNMIYALGTSPHLTPRQSFRRIHDCLCYLLDRKAPLSSLVSRALVQAGVIRPLQEGQWVSTVKFSWILQFVTIYEGDHVAAMLDNVAFTWRKEQAHKSRLRERLEWWHKQNDQVAWQYRRTLGHDSHRWKRRSMNWKPWLSDRGLGRKVEQEEEVRVGMESSESAYGSDGLAADQAGLEEAQGQTQQQGFTPMMAVQ